MSEQLLASKIDKLVVKRKYANAVFGPSEKDEKSIRDSIKKYGIQVPLIVNKDRVIIDGHTRYRIAKELKLSEVPIIVKQFEDEIHEHMFAIEINIAKRNLTEDQLSQLVVKYLDLEEKSSRKRQGHRSDLDDTPIEPENVGRATERVAKKFDISPRKVDMIRKIEREGPRDIKRDFHSGKLSTNAAYHAVMKETRPKIVTPLPSGKHNVLYIDWPWKYDNEKTGGSMISGASQKYETMTPDEIIDKYFGNKKLVCPECDYIVDFYNKTLSKFQHCPGCGFRRFDSNGKHDRFKVVETRPDDADDISKMIAKDCVLFMWMTVPMFEDQLRVVDAFKRLGFKYKHQIFWIKTGQKGMGFWLANQVEILMMCVKGKVEAFRSPLPNYVMAPFGEHSEKPEHFRHLIERVTTPMGKRRMIELFARRPAKGWTTHGNEIGTIMGGKRT